MSGPTGKLPEAVVKLQDAHLETLRKAEKVEDFNMNVCKILNKPECIHHFPAKIEQFGDAVRQFQDELHRLTPFGCKSGSIVMEEQETLNLYESVVKKLSNISQ